MAQGLNPGVGVPTGKPDVLTDASDGLELPRIVSRLSAPDRPGRQYGEHWYDLLRGKLYWWNGEVWETVASTPGFPPASEDKPPSEIPMPFGMPSLTLPRSRGRGTPAGLLPVLRAQGVGAGASGGGSGGGVAPAPGNTQTPSTPVAGGTPVGIVFDGKSSYTPTPLTCPPMSVTGPITIGTLTAGPGASNLMVGAGLQYVAPIGIGDCAIGILVDGVTILGTTNPSATSVLVTGNIPNMVAGQSYLVQYEIENNTNIAFDVSGRAVWAYMLGTTLV